MISQKFSPTDVSDINELASFLALTDGTPKIRDFDHVVLLGNSVLYTAESAFKLIQDSNAPLLISGGIGHATPYLYKSVENHSQYRAIQTRAKTEASLLKEIAVRFWNISVDRIFVEEVSTNCGGNAIQSRVLLKSNFKKLLLIQEPTMQRRSDASFRWVWKDDLSVSFQNWPVFIPKAKITSLGELYFAEPEISGLWEMERFLSLVMGEIPRLRDNGSGYGPSGKSFIAHVDVPAGIDQAFERLRGKLPVRKF